MTIYEYFVKIFIGRVIEREKLIISGGIVPRGFQKCGGPDPRDPPPPVGDASV